jgi:glyoxylase-like metal-dependent hydrolase (beta-lactamase superfamily II)
VIEDRRGITLVDPGLPGLPTWRALKKRLAESGFSIEHVHTVVITHSHPDHFGQAATLHRKFGADIVTHRSFRTFLDPQAEADDEEVEIITSLDESKANVHANPAAGRSPFDSETPWGGERHQLPLARRLRYRAMRVAGRRFMTTPRPTRRVNEADVIEIGDREWVSVHTPGHTPDHLCLLDPDNGVLISGDHILPTITPHISGMGETVDPLADFFESLDRMSSFASVGKVLPAHGLEFDDLVGRAQDIRRHHEERLTVLQEASDEIGNGTVNDYMKALFKERSWGSMAESETYAHLEHLRLLGSATVSIDDRQLRYELH